MAQTIRCTEVNFDNLSLHESKKIVKTKYNNKPVYFECSIKLPNLTLFSSNGYSTAIVNTEVINIELYNFIYNLNERYLFLSKNKYGDDIKYKSNYIFSVWDKYPTSHFHFEGTNWIGPKVQNKAILIINNGICKQKHIFDNTKLLSDNYNSDYDYIVTFSIEHKYTLDTKEFRNIFYISRLEIIRPPTEQEALDVLNHFLSNMLVLPPFKTDKINFTGGSLYKRAKKEFEQE